MNNDNSSSSICSSKSEKLFIDRLLHDAHCKRNASLSCDYRASYDLPSVSVSHNKGLLVSKHVPVHDAGILVEVLFVRLFDMVEVI